ncbi:m18 family aminopeptidase [Candidatus Colimorpha enterica]|uniref:M18 family aminopeptidase n=1 Tax=Candidatus Colimorpha enterica TaxID=3083063 RepID=R6TG86_9BACT|nr:m18 family aminopeptidase [Candidatus Colimorpha enterica]
MNAKELKEELEYKNRSAFESISEDELERSFAYAESYKLFLDNCKTEREAVKYSVAMAKRRGYTEYRLGDDIAVGGKYYYNNRGKQLVVFRVGEEPLENGAYIMAAHIDSPRLDLKQNPLYEDSGLGLFKTHYYGGIKKYQWTAVPLALHGIVMKSDGTSVDICIGEDEDEPIFYVSDLLPHLAKDQMSKSLAEGITGEGLNIIVGSEPYREEETDGAIKLNLLRILNEKYGMCEEDFLSAELTAVPAMHARDIGLDRSLIAGYGHDDRVCAYSELTALLDSNDTAKTVFAVLADKEETGSDGVSGMQSELFADILAEVCEARGANYRVVKANSKCLSADVNAAYDPNFPEVLEKKNACYANCGVVLSKFTGARGKSGTSDATSEFTAYVRSFLNKNGVVWQMAELGKVDQGGGGTVAKFIANMNIDTIDVGVPVISMHAPYEAISKLDLYMTYKAFCAFIG